MVGSRGRAVALGGGPDDRAEALAQGGAGAESDGLGHALDRQIGLLQQLLGPADPASGDPAGRRGADLFAKAAVEGAL